MSCRFSSPSGKHHEVFPIAFCLRVNVYFASPYAAFTRANSSADSASTDPCRNTNGNVIPALAVNLPLARSVVV